MENKIEDLADAVEENESILETLSEMARGRTRTQRFCHWFSVRAEHSFLIPFLIGGIISMMFFIRCLMELPMPVLVSMIAFLTTVITLLLIKFGMDFVEKHK